MERGEEAARFERDGYVVLPGFLDDESTATFCRIVREAPGWSDEQVPGAKSLRDHPALDGMLEQVLPNVEYASGRRLLPTYAYARVYKRGDVLRPHKDRSACEISVTLCLGSDGTPWPIYMADGEFDPDTHEIKSRINVRGELLNPGDAVLYKGCEKVHWRDEFQGEWMAQVFLHYVDADGPYADQKYDGRARLAHHADESLPPFVVVEDAINPEAAMRVVAQLEAEQGEQAGIGGGDRSVIDRSIRDVVRVSLPVRRGIGAAMAGIGLAVNEANWRFAVTHANQCDFLRYHGETGGHYHAHVDTFFHREQPCRKLSVLCFLNDDFEGGRFFLQIGERREYPQQKPGSVVVFPSFLLHGVEPVTKGTRCSMVTWLVGPWFK